MVNEFLLSTMAIIPIIIVFIPLNSNVQRFLISFQILIATVLILEKLR